MRRPNQTGGPGRGRSMEFRGTYPDFGIAVETVVPAIAWPKL